MTVTRRACVLVLIAAIVPCAPWAAGTATATTTTTTLPTIPPSTLCTCSNLQCVVTGHHTLDPGSIDFGTCALVLGDRATVTLSSPGILQISAATLSLNARATIVGSGGIIVVNVPGTIDLATRASIDVSTLDASSASITLTAGGAVTLGGSLVARATDPTGSGGTVDVTAGGTATPGDVVIGDRITVRGGGQGGGGDVSITALNGTITVNAPIDASGGEFDGGSIDLEADRDLVVNNGTGVTLDVSGGGLSGFGGLVVLDSNVAGDVTINAPVVGGAGGSTAEGGGDGGELDATTYLGNVVVNAPVTVNGGSNGGGGGTVDLEPTGDLNVTQPLLASGTGTGAIGGDVTFYVSGVATLSSLIDVSATGSQGSAGNMSLNAPGFAGATATLLPGTEINADSAPGTAAGGGGWIQLVDQTVTVDGFLHANGGGGDITLQACGLTVQAGAQIWADGTGFNLLQASGPMQVLGTLIAGTNTLDYFDPANTPSTAGATITPAPTIVQNTPVFAPLCPGQITTSTTSSTSTTATLPTTTTVSSTTSTTATLPTTTTVIVGTSSTTTSTSPTTSLAPSTSTTTSTTTSTSHPTPATTSTTRRAPPVTSTTLSTTPSGGVCTPPLCDDRGLCEPGSCLDGKCDYVPMIGLDAVSCRLDQMRALFETAPPNAIHGHALGRKLLAKLAKLGRLVQTGRGGGRGSSKALRQADHGIAMFIGALQSATHLGKLDTGLAGRVIVVASDAKAVLDPLLTHP